MHRLAATKITMDVIEQDSSENYSELISAVKQGDKASFKHLYEAEKGRVFAICLRLTKNRELSEELTQESFIQAWKKIKQFRGDSKFSTWLHRLTTNIVLDRIRLKRHEYEENSEELDLSIPADPSLDDDRRDLEMGISKLPDGARTVFVLFELQGFSHEEISDKVGIAIGTSKAQLHRAKSMLKEWLSQ